VLSIDQLARYRRDGYLAIADFASPEACAALRERADEIVDAFEPTEHSTAGERATERQLFESGAGIRCFFEPEAPRPGGDEATWISKIGHALHDLDPVFEAFSYTRELAEVAADVGLVDPLAVQSAYVIKRPSSGGDAGCHQDATFIYTDPITVTGFWFAIEDATLDNGCLWVQPGGHCGPLRRVFQRADDLGDGATRFVELDDTPLPAAPRDLVPLVVTRGTLVVLHGLLPHWSDVNRSPVSRHAYSLHCVSAAAEYPPTNWLQRPPELPFRRLDEVSRTLR
jgi:phytanoyl-CoA hydroxylase